MTSISAGGSTIGSTVETGEIVDGAVTAAKLATDAVETAKIKDANVTEAKIAASAVALSKLKSDALANFLHSGYYSDFTSQSNNATAEGSGDLGSVTVSAGDAPNGMLIIAHCRSENASGTEQTVNLAIDIDGTNKKTASYTNGWNALDVNANPNTSELIAFEATETTDYDDSSTTTVKLQAWSGNAAVANVSHFLLVIPY